MNFIKRIFLFILINLLVVITISTLLSIFKVGPYLNAYGLDINKLAIFCLLWGFAGALISLFLSKSLAKWMMKVQIIDEDSDVNSKFILDTVKKIALEAGLENTPEVGLYESNEVNAFATGPTKKRSLLALSSGLINRLPQDEIEAIIGHEISHISNGDMITMTLLQGVVNAFVMFLARILAFLISSSNRKSRSSYSSGHYFFVYLFEIIFMILGSIVLASFSRKREFRADENSANLIGRDKMINALTSLKALHSSKDLKKQVASFQALKIFNPSKRGLLNLFSTHPPIDDRIERLKNL